MVLTSFATSQEPHGMHLPFFTPADDEVDPVVVFVISTAPVTIV